MLYLMQIGKSFKSVFSYFEDNLFCTFAVYDVS